MNNRKLILGISTLSALLLVAASGNVDASQMDVKPPKMEMTTEIPESIIIPNKLETRIGVLEFFDGLPTEATVRKAYDFLDFQRAVDVFLDEIRAASMVALRDGHRALGITKSNQVVIFEDLMDSKSLWLTANTETVYASTFIDLKDGPVVVESPPNVLGILDDMWMRYVGDIGNAGPDRGKGGNFLILPPDYKGSVPEGYHVYHSKTYGVWFLLRGFLVDGDTAPAVANIKKHLHIFPLAESSKPPVMEFKNASGMEHNTIHANDFHFFEELNSLIQEEHDDAINADARGRLALLGIVKGQPFNPDKRIRNTLNEAALVGAGIARSMSFASRDRTIYFYPDDDRTWFNPFAIGNHEFMAGSWLHRDARTVFMYNAIGITPAMAIAMPGIGSQYAAAVRDANGDYLNGSKTYRLTLPPNVPAKDFWSIVLYDTQTRSMLQTDQQFPSLNSERGGVEQNADGSFDIYFGPKAPQGEENNWVQTVPGKGFLLILRLYGPLGPWFDKTWRPGRIKLMLKTPPEIAIPVTISPSDSFEDQVSAYIKNYPYQETYKYIQFYTGASVKGLNVWFWPPEPSLTKAGDDKVVRMNNDTFYNGIVLDLSKGPVVLGTEAADNRFYSFQLQDDRNVNYANIIQPEGEYTFYYGEKPENIVGKAVEAASELSIIIVRIEVKDKNDAHDVAAATKVYKSLTSSGEQPAEFPIVDVLSQFSEEVATEADQRITETFMNSEVSDIVLNLDQELGTDISYLAHAAATKGVWGGPDSNHSMYDTLFNDVNGEQLDSRKGTYSVTTKAPNVNGFWSVTAYDTDRGGFFHPNKDDHYHFNEATAVVSSDGTYTFTFKQECQTTDINCLEVPEGLFDVVARYYLPSKEIINREWIFPNIELHK